jgi:hypothetical protein
MQQFDLKLEVTKRPTSRVVMPFGRHLGNEVRELPSSYLSWIIESMEIGRFNAVRWHIYDVACDEFSYRNHSGHPPEPPR